MEASFKILFTIGKFLNSCNIQPWQIQVDLIRRYGTFKFSAQLSPF